MEQLDAPHSRPYGNLFWLVQAGRRPDIAANRLRVNRRSRLRYRMRELCEAFETAVEAGAGCCNSCIRQRSWTKIAGFRASPASDRWILAGGACDACEYLCPGNVRLCLLRPDAPSNSPTLQILAALCAWCPLSTHARANTRTHAHTAHTAHTPPSTHPHLTSAPFGIPWHAFSSGIPSGMVRRPASRNVGWDAL
jgi:hypothetical protein